MANRMRQEFDRDFERNQRYDENYREQGNYGQRTGESDWEQRQARGRDYSRNEPWNPEYWENRQQGRDYEVNRNRNWGQDQQRGYEGYDNRSRNQYETGDFGTRDYGSGQYGSRTYGSNYGQSGYGNENRYGQSRDVERSNIADPRSTYGNYWGSNYDRGQQSRWGGADYNPQGYTTVYGGGQGSRTYGSSTPRGQFVGRGPKNFSRTDERIREDIIERLTMHPDIDASEIDVQVKSAEVTLTGTIDDREQRRMAEDLCENIWGVRDVHNQIKVNKPSLWDRMTGQTETTATGEKVKKDKAA